MAEQRECEVVRVVSTIPQTLKDQLQVLARANRRSQAREIQVAIEQRVSSATPAALSAAPVATETTR